MIIFLTGTDSFYAQRSVVQQQRGTSTDTTSLLSIYYIYTEYTSPTAHGRYNNDVCLKKN
jgi:hypothetical protein